jgi:hypothetical protein
MGVPIAGQHEKVSSNCERYLNCCRSLLNWSLTCFAEKCCERSRNGFENEEERSWEGKPEVLIDADWKGQAVLNRSQIRVVFIGRLWHVPRGKQAEVVVGFSIVAKQIALDSIIFAFPAKHTKRRSVMQQTPKRANFSLQLHADFSRIIAFTYPINRAVYSPVSDDKLRATVSRFAHESCRQ